MVVAGGFGDVLGIRGLYSQRIYTFVSVKGIRYIFWDNILWCAVRASKVYF